MAKIRKTRDGKVAKIIQTYSQAVRQLAEAEDPLAADAVLGCLLLRDTIAELHSCGNAGLAGELITVLEADESLSALAARLSSVPEVEAFRRRFTPSAEAWWWHLRPPSVAERYIGMLKTLTLVCLALTVGFVTDLRNRFSYEGVDFLGAITIAMPTLLAILSAGSVLFEAFDRRLAEICSLFKIPAAWRGLATALCGILALSTAFLAWQARPQIARYYNDSGVVAFQEDRLADAEAAFGRAVSLDPSYIRAHYNLGSTYEQLQQSDKAKRSYRIAFAAGDLSAANNLGRLLLLEQEADQAAQVLQWAETKLQPETKTEIRYTILKNLGWARFEQQRNDVAEAYLERAISLDPERPTAKCLLAKVRHARREHTGTDDGWQACLRTDSWRIEEDRWKREANDYLRQRTRRND